MSLILDTHLGKFSNDISKVCWKKGASNYLNFMGKFREVGEKVPNNWRQAEIFWVMINRFFIDFVKTSMP